MCGLTNRTNQTFNIFFGIINNPYPLSLRGRLKLDYRYHLRFCSAQFSSLHTSLYYSHMLPKLILSTCSHLAILIELWFKLRASRGSCHSHLTQAFSFLFLVRGRMGAGSERELPRVHRPRLYWCFHQKPRGIIYQSEVSLPCKFKEENVEGNIGGALGHPGVRSLHYYFERKKLGTSKW